MTAINPEDTKGDGSNVPLIPGDVCIVADASTRKVSCYVATDTGNSEVGDWSVVPSLNPGVWVWEYLAISDTLLSRTIPDVPSSIIVELMNGAPDGWVQRGGTLDAMAVFHATTTVNTPKAAFFDNLNEIVQFVHNTTTGTVFHYMNSEALTLKTAERAPASKVILEIAGTFPVVGDKVYMMVSDTGSAGNAFYCKGLSDYAEAWTQKASLNENRQFHAMVAAPIFNKIYAIGGENGGTILSCEEYDIATNTWTYKASLPPGVASKFMGACQYGNQIFVIDSQGILYSYDIFGNAWSTIESSPAPYSTYSVISTSFENKMIMVGGYGKNRSILVLDLNDMEYTEYKSPIACSISSCSAVAVAVNRVLVQTKTAVFELILPGRKFVINS